MSTSSVEIPAHREFTIEDLAGFPADGNRYELIEGSLHVSPAPNLLHQRVVAGLVTAFATACPPGLDVFGSPADVLLGPRTVVQPDLLILVADDRGRQYVDTVPLLVVEVLSPSTRLYDLGTKQLAYRNAGVPAYLVVDPMIPAITEYRWTDDREAARTATGEERFVIEDPFPLTIVPSELVKPAGDRRREP